MSNNELITEIQRDVIAKAALNALGGRYNVFETPEGFVVKQKDRPIVQDPVISLATANELSTLLNTQLMAEANRLIHKKLEELHIDPDITQQRAVYYKARK